MADIGWRRRRGVKPRSPKGGARQRAGLTPALRIQHTFMPAGDASLTTAQVQSKKSIEQRSRYLPLRPVASSSRCLALQQTWPLAGAGRSSASACAAIGVLMHLAADRSGRGNGASPHFCKACRRVGWAVGRNVDIDVRWAAGEARSLFVDTRRKS